MNRVNPGLVVYGMHGTGGIDDEAGVDRHVVFGKDGEVLGRFDRKYGLLDFDGCDDSFVDIEDVDFLLVDVPVIIENIII